jgi:hypothetical protein
MDLVSLAGNLECLDVAEVSLEEFSLLPSSLVHLHIQPSSGCPNVGKAVADSFVRCKTIELFECHLVGSEMTMQDMDEAKLMAETRRVRFLCTSSHDDGGKVDWKVGETWCGRTTWMHS